tara:strand:+ start:118 stop:519 length:402 start_codon:yes stop_codon:yes gene_type:complete
MEKKSKIVKSVFSNEWTNPSGGTTYYYDVALLNGDVGSCGVSEKDSVRVKVGSQVNYQINGTKIKIVSVENSAEKKYSGYKKGGRITKDSMLGYSWSYAKDAWIGGKTMADIQELDEMATYIYNRIGEMLNDD